MRAVVGLMLGTGILLGFIYMEYGSLEPCQVLAQQTVRDLSRKSHEKYTSTAADEALGYRIGEALAVRSCGM
jgi:hypothetical protein